MCEKVETNGPDGKEGETERQRVCREICEINQRQAKQFSKKIAAARKREREGAISKSQLVSVRDELERERAKSDMYTSVCLF